MGQTSSTSSTWSSAMSGSGDTTHSSSLGGVSEKNSQSSTNIRRGVLGWIFGEGLRKLTTFVQGTELLRSGSAVTPLASEGAPRLGESPSSGSTGSQDRLGELPVDGWQNGGAASSHMGACSSSSGDAAD